MENVLPFLVSLSFGVLCAMIANSRGRNAVGWFAIGFIFSCLGPVGLLVLPDLKAQEERERELRLENRRLREQLKKDRAVADARYAQTARRLGAHDRALGMDTAHAELEAPPVSAQPQLGPEGIEAKWYYLDRTRERRGPLTFDAFRAQWEAGELTPQTLVWARVLEDWTPLSDVPGLMEELHA